MLGAVMFAHAASQEGLRSDHQPGRESRQGPVGPRHHDDKAAVKAQLKTSSARTSTPLTG